MSRPCERPDCGTVAEVRIRWIGNAEEARVTWIREVEGKEASAVVSTFLGCRAHAREAWAELSGAIRYYREVN